MRSIFLSAGHSNTDPGAVGRHPGADGKLVDRIEADVAVEFRNLVAFYLQRAGVPFEPDGHGTTNIPLRAAVVKARTHPIAVEFHCNAAANPTATGVETLSSERNKVLGGELCKALSTELKLRNRGAKGEADGQHHRLGFVQAGGIIVELFFISNPSDVAAYDARKWLAARAVAEALEAESKR